MRPASAKATRLTFSPSHTPPHTHTFSRTHTHHSFTLSELTSDLDARSGAGDEGLLGLVSNGLCLHLRGKLGGVHGERPPESFPASWGVFRSGYDISNMF